MGAEPPYTFYTFFATFDFGAHWQKLPVSNALVVAAGHVQGHIYALAGTIRSSDLKRSGSSGDQMASWQVDAQPSSTRCRPFG